MSDPALQATITGSFGLVIVIIQKLWPDPPPRKRRPSSETEKEKNRKHRAADRLRAIVSIGKFPALSVLVGMALYWAGFNGVRMLLGAGPEPLVGAPIPEWLLSGAAEITAWALSSLAVLCFLGAQIDFVNLARWARKSLEPVFRSGRKVEEHEALKLERNDTPMKYRRLIALGILFLFISGGILVVRHLAAQNLPPNARLMKEAWDEFNKGDWRAAVQKAGDCVSQFRDSADDEQADLEKRHALIPSGKVSKQAQIEIIDRGPLNDVATSFWIEGQALEKLNDIDGAKKAYEAASKYTYARCYDRGWDGFWSPSERAGQRLRHLKM